ncbi:hypothetical protein OsJ_35444 [Oryza sativa Japonica Group]|uniref:Uncharacterized protein n=1 Tax=Oryza sativa subsp. japonica TaxID=39947 RepID=A3CFJ7_ORYSJ|nr:hypothetical protein OsJ_35444 [Oryza sativa Japonica Group]
MEEFTFPSVAPERCNAGKKPPFSPHFATPPPWFGGGVVVDAVVYDHRRSFSAVEKGEEEGTVRGGWYYCYDDGGCGQCLGEVRPAARRPRRWTCCGRTSTRELSRAAAAAPLAPLSKEWTKEAWLAGDGTPEMRRHAAAAAAVASGSVVRRRRLS